MNNEDLLKNMDLIEDPYIEEAAGSAEAREDAENDSGASGEKEAVRRALRILIPVAILSAAAAVALLVSRAFYHPLKPNETPYETRHVVPGETEPETRNEITPEPAWGEREIYERFTAMDFQGIHYESCWRRIEESSVGEKLGDVHLVTSDWDGNTEETDAEVFTLNGMDPAYAVAVRYQDTEGTYSFVNRASQPKDLAAFMDALDLKTRLVTMDTASGVYKDQNGHYHTIEFEGITREFVLEEVLEACKDAPYTPELIGGVNELSFGVLIPEFNDHFMTFSVNTENGILWTNILGVGHYFIIGEDAAKDLIEKVNRNFKGYEIIYDYQEEPGVPEIMPEGEESAPGIPGTGTETAPNVPGGRTETSAESAIENTAEPGIETTIEYTSQAE